jgi:wyosine [tRNA(Phe)-imidazoG37] synthetase (radical SAM superfamily)|tara:strand:- start:712 stop:1101 length:390 start_codon:yes stop_codon:yes gene_type:complete
LFEALNKIPFYTYVNIGLESGDEATLARIQKPLEIQKIEDAFEMMLEVNRGYPNIEITANFLMGDRFPLDHYRSIIELARNRLDRFYSKGAIYLSALNTSQNKRGLFSTFVEIKKLSRPPAYLYLIQRL